MRWLCFLVLSIVLAALLLFSATGQNAPGLNRSFSAIAVITIDGQPPLQEHVYLDRGRQRIDYDSHDPGMSGAYQLILMQENKAFLVLPESHRCLTSDVSRLPVAARQRAGAEIAAVPPAHVRPLGAAVVDGQLCEIRQWQATARNGQPMTIRTWTTKDARQLPVKMQIENPGSPTMTVRYTAMKPGPPPALLFELPAACQAFPGGGPHR